MIGIDVSHWQGTINWSKVKNSGVEFAIIKCSESINFVDAMFYQNKTQARKAGVLCGYYHFARGGDYKKEADWFLKNVGDLKEGELIALDYEIYTLPDPADWCEKWLSYVESKVGFKPMLYTYHALLNKYNWEKVSDNNFGLWAARYGSSKIYIPHYLCLAPTSATFPFWAIWQYSSKGTVAGISGNVDMNHTKMNIETLKKYGKKEELECTHCPIHCPKE